MCRLVLPCVCIDLSCQEKVVDTARPGQWEKCTVTAEITKGKYHTKKILPKKKPKPTIEVVLVIVVSPQFLGPKKLIICSTAGPCFLCGVLLSWMGMLFRLWWWMRTGRGLVCQLPGNLWVAEVFPKKNGDCFHTQKRVAKGFCLDDAPFARIPKYYPKKIHQKMGAVG